MHSSINAALISYNARGNPNDSVRSETNSKLLYTAAATNTSLQGGNSRTRNFFIQVSLLAPSRKVRAKCLGRRRGLSQKWECFSFGVHYCHYTTVFLDSYPHRYRWHSVSLDYLQWTGNGEWIKRLANGVVVPLKVAKRNSYNFSVMSSGQGSRFRCSERVHVQ